MPLGTDVGLIQGRKGDIMLHGDQAPHRERGKQSPPPTLFSPCLLWPNGWLDQDATWYEVRQSQQLLSSCIVTYQPRVGVRSIAGPWLMQSFWQRNRIRTSCVMDDVTFCHNGRHHAWALWCVALAIGLSPSAPSLSSQNFQRICQTAPRHCLTIVVRNGSKLRTEGEIWCLQDYNCLVSQWDVNVNTSLVAIFTSMWPIQFSTTVLPSVLSSFLYQLLESLVWWVTRLLNCPI